MAEKPLPARLSRLRDGSVRGPDVMTDAVTIEAGIARKGRMKALIEEGEEELGLGVGGVDAGVLGEAVGEQGVRQRGVGFEVAGEEGEDGGVGGEVFHEDGGQLGEVGGAAGAGDVLQGGAAEDGVDGVAHFVEEGLDLVEGEEGGAVRVRGEGEVAD